MKKAIFLMLTITFLSCGKDSNLINGKVSNTSGDPIENVLIQVMGTDLNSRTNTKGEFRINTRNRGDELIFTHPDYEMQRIDISDESQYSVKLIKRNNQ